MTSNTRSWTLLLVFVAGGGWGPVSHGREGAAGPHDAPVVRVKVLRDGREKSIGLDAQLASLRPDRGQLLVSTSEAAEPAADFKLRFSWRTAKEACPSDKAPALVAADVGPARQALLLAMAGSYPSQVMARLVAQPPTNRADSGWEVIFPAPRSGLSLARQFRVARKLVAARLAAMNMMSPSSGTWPPDFRPGKALALYDAEGVGYYGSTLLDRAVDETTLDARTLAVCPEDIREGILDRCIGVLFPGGTGRGIATALQSDGVKRVRNFVAKGGGYFGVCAGAYFADSGLSEFTGMIPLVHDQPWAKGQARLKLGLTPAGVALLGEEFRTIETRYNCGPVFTNLFLNGRRAPVTVLACFDTPATDRKGVVRREMVGTPAILSMAWQKGRIMIVSPHPEGQPKFYPLVARAIGWTIGVDPNSVQARVPSTPVEGHEDRGVSGGACRVEPRQQIARYSHTPENTPSKRAMALF